MTYALGTSRGRITKAPLLLIDVETEEGVTGRAYLWSYFRQAMPAIASILQEVEERTQGERVEPEALWAKLAERFALIGVQGIVRMAMAGFDVACWDALRDRGRRAAGRRCSAREPRPIPAYNSCGLGLMPLDALADEAEKLLAARLPRHQAPARLSDARRGHRRGARGEAAHPGRRRADGRLQPGAQRGRSADARARARPRGHRLAGGADPARRLCRRGDARARARRADPDRRELLAASPACGRRSTPRPAIW